ncbi:MAG: hypothetical protein L3J53_07085 [Proteobacteria bacterium]|nr:hypothetical protein [Pseudomonadota bacterium]
MKNNKLIAAMAIAMSLSLVSCGGDDETKTEGNVASPATVASVQQQASIMDFIPADTPILMVFAHDPKNPLPQNFLDKANKVYDSFGKFLIASIEEKTQTGNSTDTENNAENNDAKVDEFLQFTQKWLNKDSFEKLGLTVDETEFALYAVDLFPVLRVTLAKQHSIDELFDELVAKANESKPDSAIKRDVNGKTIYQFGDKELQVMVNVDGNSLVASIAPPREVDSLMPKLLGFEKPTKTLKQSSQYQDTVSKYNYLGNSLYWFNIRQLADYFVNPDQHNTVMLDIMKVQDNMLSPDCKTEILEIVDKTPRMVGGYTLFAEHEMKSHMIIEMEQGLGSKFASLSGRIPKAGNDVALSYGFSFDIAAAKTLAQEFASNIEAVPYKCEFLQGMNAGATKFSAQLNKPMPPFVSNFKGFNVVIDKLDFDFSKTEPSEMIKTLNAKLLLAVDNPEALLGMAAMMVPDIQKLDLKAGVDAVNVSSLIPATGTMMPINLDHVFMALGTETIGVSLGEGTDTSLTSTVAADATNALVEYTIQADLYDNIFQGISDMNLGLSDEVKKQFAMQQMLMGDMLWWQTQSGNMNFTDRGFEFNNVITY